MADKRPLNETASAPSFEEKVFDVAYRARDSWQKNQTLWSVVAAVVVCIAGAWGFWAWKTRTAESDANRLLGIGFVHLENQKPDSALAMFDRLASDHSGLAVSKASLMAGGILFAKGDWKGAEARFRRAIEESKGLPLLDGSARRGLASSLIEQARYEEAAKELQKIVDDYSHTSMVPAEREKADGKVDDLPTLSQPLWQLVLVQEKLGKKEQALKSAERLLRTYPHSDEANEAQRWLALQGLPSPT